MNTIRWNFPKWTQKTLPSTEQSAVVRDIRRLWPKKMWIMWLMDLRHFTGKIIRSWWMHLIWPQQILSRLWERQWKSLTTARHLYSTYTKVSMQRLILYRKMMFPLKSSSSAVTRECRTWSSLQMMRKWSRFREVTRVVSRQSRWSPRKTIP